MKTPKKIQSVKGVSTRGLTVRQSIQLKEHSVHHTKKHIVEMVKEMRKGKVFQCHIILQCVKLGNNG